MIGLRNSAPQAVASSVRKVEWTKRRSPSPLCAKKRMPAGMRTAIAGPLFPLTAIIFILLDRGRRIVPICGNTAACTPVTVRCDWKSISATKSDRPAAFPFRFRLRLPPQKKPVGPASVCHNLRDPSLRQAAADGLLPLFELFPVELRRRFHSAHRAEHCGIVSASGKNRLASAKKAGKEKLRTFCCGGGGVCSIVWGHGHALRICFMGAGRQRMH